MKKQTKAELEKKVAQLEARLAKFNAVTIQPRNLAGESFAVPLRREMFKSDYALCSRIHDEVLQLHGEGNIISGSNEPGETTTWSLRIWDSTILPGYSGIVVVYSSTREDGVLSSFDESNVWGIIEVPAVSKTSGWVSV